MNTFIKADDVSATIYSGTTLASASSGTKYAAAETTDGNWGRHGGWCSDSSSSKTTDGFFNEYHNPNNDPARFAIRLKLANLGVSKANDWEHYILTNLKLNIYMGCAKYPTNLKGHCYVYTKDPSAVSTFATASTLVQLDGFLKDFTFDIPSISTDSATWLYQKTTINMNFAKNKIEITYDEYKNKYLYFYFVATCTNGYTKTGAAVFPEDSKKAAYFEPTFKQNSVTFNFYNIPDGKGGTQTYTYTQTYGEKTSGSKSESLFNKYHSVSKELPYCIQFYTGNENLGYWYNSAGEKASTTAKKKSDIINIYPFPNKLFSYSNSAKISGSVKVAYGCFYKENSFKNKYSETDSFQKIFGETFAATTNGTYTYNLYYHEDTSLLSSAKLTIKKSDLTSRITPISYYQSKNSWIFLQYDNYYTKVSDIKNLKFFDTSASKSIELPVYTTKYGTSTYLKKSNWIAYPCCYGKTENTVGIVPIDYTLYAGKVTTSNNQLKRTSDSASSIYKVGTFNISTDKKNIATLINTAIDEYPNVTPSDSKPNTYTQKVPVYYSYYPETVAEDYTGTNAEASIVQLDNKVRTLSRLSSVDSTTFKINKNVSSVGINKVYYDSFTFNTLKSLLNPKAANSIILTSTYSYKFQEDTSKTYTIFAPGKQTITLSDEEYQWSGSSLVNGYLKTFSSDEKVNGKKITVPSSTNITIIHLYYLNSSSDSDTDLIPFIAT